MLNKKEFIAKIASENDITKAMATDVLEATLNGLVAAIRDDGGVNISGIGKIYVEEVPEKTGICQLGEKKGQTWVSPAHKTVKSKVGKALKSVVE